MFVGKKDSEIDEFSITNESVCDEVFEQFDNYENINKDFQNKK